MVECVCVCGGGGGGGTGGGGPYRGLRFPLLFNAPCAKEGKWRIINASDRFAWRDRVGYIRGEMLSCTLTKTVLSSSPPPPPPPPHLTKHMQVQIKNPRKLTEFEIQRSSARRKVIHTHIHYSSTVPTFPQYLYVFWYRGLPEEK